MFEWALHRVYLEAQGDLNVLDSPYIYIFMCISH